MIPNHVHSYLETDTPHCSAHLVLETQSFEEEEKNRGKFEIFEN